jgi:hypothetical protein
MAQVTVYMVTIWNHSAGNSYVSRRMATEKGAATMGGEITPGTGVQGQATDASEAPWQEQAPFSPAPGPAA